MSAPCWREAVKWPGSLQRLLDFRFFFAGWFWWWRKRGQEFLNPWHEGRCGRFQPCVIICQMQFHKAISTSHRFNKTARCLRRRCRNSWIFSPREPHLNAPQLASWGSCGPQASGGWRALSKVLWWAMTFQEVIPRCMHLQMTIRLKTKEIHNVLHMVQRHKEILMRLQKNSMPATSPKKPTKYLTARRATVIAVMRVTRTSLATQTNARTGTRPNAWFARTTRLPRVDHVLGRSSKNCRRRGTTQISWREIFFRGHLGLSGLLLSFFVQYNSWINILNFQCSLHC